MFVRRVPDTVNFLRHVMRVTVSVRPKCSHRCVSLKETPVYEQKTSRFGNFSRSIWQFFMLYFPSTWIHCSQMLYFQQFLSTAIEPKVAKWTCFCPLKNDKNAINKGKRQSCQIDPCLPPHRKPLLNLVQILKHTTKNSTEQTTMRTKWFKHIAI